MIPPINKNLFYKTHSFIVRSISYIVKTGYGLLRLHPTSYPYISGDSFRNLCKLVWDVEHEHCPFSGDDIQWGDLVYVATNHVLDFFNLIKMHDVQPFILISGNDDKNIDNV